jgi:hypothetical protein
MLLQKVIGYPLDPFACGNRELHATPRISNIPLGELNFKYIKRRRDKKNPSLIRDSYNIGAYQTITLSGRSNLVRRYLCLADKKSEL